MPVVKLAFTIFLTLFASAGLAANDDEPPRNIGLPRQDSSVVSSGLHTLVIEASATSKTAIPYKPVGISYHGGRVLDSGVNVFLFWYGAWSSKQKSIVHDLINGFGPKNGNNPGTTRRWWTINSLYYNAKGGNLSSNISIVKEVSDPSYLYGHSLPLFYVRGMIKSRIVAGDLPAGDKNGIIILLTSSDVNVTGFCDQYCSYSGTISVCPTCSEFAFMWIGNPNISTTCLKRCTTGYSVNNDTGVDGMALTISATLSSIVTNVDSNAWYDTKGYTDAQKCAWKLGTLNTTSTGQKFNLRDSGRKYLLQQLWNPKVGACTSQP